MSAADGIFCSFVELHIEQGPLLEERGLPSASSPRSPHRPRLRITWKGEGGYAGAV